MTFKINSVKPNLDQENCLVANCDFTFNDGETKNIDVTIVNAATIDDVQIACNNRGASMQNQINLATTLNGHI